MAHTKDFIQNLSNILVKHKTITQEHAQELQRLFEGSPKEQFDDFLLEEGFVEKPDLLRALAEHYQVPANDVTGEFFDTFLLQKFPKDFLLRNAVIPLEVDEKILVVVANEPEKDGLESAMREFVSHDITYQVGLKRNICNAVKEFYDAALTESSRDPDVYKKEQEEKSIDDVLSSDDDISS